MWRRVGAHAAASGEGVHRQVPNGQRRGGIHQRRAGGLTPKQEPRRPSSLRHLDSMGSMHSVAEPEWLQTRCAGKGASAPGGPASAVHGPLGRSRGRMREVCVLHLTPSFLFPSRSDIVYATSELTVPVQAGLQSWNHGRLCSPSPPKFHVVWLKVAGPSPPRGHTRSSPPLAHSAARPLDVSLRLTARTHIWLTDGRTWSLRAVAN